MTNCSMLSAGVTCDKHVHQFGRLAPTQRSICAPKVGGKRQRLPPVCVHTPLQRTVPVTNPGKEVPQHEDQQHLQQAAYISDEAVCSIERALDEGESIKALRRFDTNLKALTLDNWKNKLRPVLNELAFNLESFNPAFAAVVLKVQCSIGHSDYVRRDDALKALIQPLAGEYGMHNGALQGATHRQLFSDWYEGLWGESLEALMAEGTPPAASHKLFAHMMRDIMSGGQTQDPVDQACYAMGYNLAIEYMASYEKPWMLAAFRHLNKSVLAPNGHALTEWLFLEVHAEGDHAEAEHAELGHAAITTFVPSGKEALLRCAALDHDRDFAAFYNSMADMLE